MGRVSQQRRNRNRMTKYNSDKASKKLQDKDITIEILNKEVSKLNTDNQDLKEALQKQKDHYISRHNSILQKLDIRHSIKLKEAIEACKREYSAKHSIIQYELFQCQNENSYLKEKVRARMFSSVYGNEQVEPVDMRKFEPIDLRTIPKTPEASDASTTTIRGYTRVPSQQHKKVASATIPGD